MGKVKWTGGIDASTFDNAERGGFEPYMGPAVPNAVYCWKIKILRIGKSSGGHKQLIIGLELTPRRSRPDEKKFKGYFITDYQVVTEASAPFVAEFLDGLGVTGKDFVNLDTRGEVNARGSMEVAKMGRWVNNGKQYIMAGLVDGADASGQPRKEIKGYWPIPEEASTSEPDDDEDTDNEEEEEERPAKRTTSKKRRPEPEPDEDEAEYEDEAPPPRKRAAKKAVPKSRAAEVEEDEDDEPPF